MTRLVVAFLATFLAVPLASADTLTLDDRIACRRAIEQVMWAHREWPSENPDPKPALDVLLPPARLRERAEDDLRKSDALRRVYQYSVSEEQLQSELDRMARDSRDPDLLREIFAALGNDPRLAAECLARPAVTDRMIRTLFAHDETRTGPVRARAEAALAEARLTGVDQARHLMDAGAVVELNRYGPARQDEESDPHIPKTISVEEGPVAGSSMQQWSLSESAWSQRVISLAREFGTQIPTVSQGEASPLEVADRILANLPRGTPSALAEDNRSLFVRMILECRSTEYVEVATVRWMKPSFEEWWGEHRMEFDPSTSPAGDSDGGEVSDRIQLPAITATPCTDDTWFNLPWSGPDARSGHLAIWTGSEMIVWGGTYPYSFGETPSGGRYDPATDSWTPLPLNPDVPNGATEFSMTWTGTEVFIYGGMNELFGPHFSGGLYSPLTNRWTGVYNSPARELRYHTAIWTGTEVILWGGLNVLNYPVNTGWRFNPSTGVWTSTSTGSGVPVSRWKHTAVWTNGRMIIWGGDDGAGAVDDGAAYNPTTDSWTPITTSGAPSPRRYHSAVWTGSEMIVWGGESATAYLSDGGRYKPLTNSWTATAVGPNTPAGRSKHTAIWTGSEMIIWGGGSSTGGRYNPATNSWDAVSTLNAPASGSAIWTGTEMIVWGGNTTYGARYNPITNVWVPIGATVPGAPVAPTAGTAVWTGTEVLAWSLNGGSRYTPATNSWAAMAPSFGKPQGPAVWSGKELIAVGGDIGERYNPMTNAWAVTNKIGAPVARISFVAVWTGREVIVWGGEIFGQHVGLNSGGRYDPATDTWKLTSTGTGVPTGRWLHAGVWTGKEMLIWGGFTPQGRLGDGARYDPLLDVWQPMSSSGAPVARQGPTAVWTGSMMIVWGGYGNAGRLNDGGLYDPDSDAWGPTSLGPGVPSARDEHVAVWTGTEMLVWGGKGLDLDSNGFQTFEPVPSGGRYDPTTDQWTPTSIGPGTHLSSENPLVAVTGSQVFLLGGLYSSIQGIEGVTSGSLYCASSCSTPIGRPSLLLTRPVGSAAALLDWTWTAGTSSFDVVRGGLSVLSTSGGNFTVSTDQCLGQRIASNGASDASIPAAGDGFWYLVRAEGCNAGSYDDGTQVGSRDAQIAASGAACP